MNNLATFLRESRTARLFMSSGMILIAFSIIVFFINSRNSDYIEIESTVSNVQLAREAYTDSDGIRVEATYDVNIKYNVAGKEYQGQLVEVNKYNIGDKIKIYYNPDDPTQITQTKSMLVPIIAFIAGIISFIGGIISALKALKKHKTMKAQEEGWKNGQ